MIYHWGTVNRSNIVSNACPRETGLRRILGIRWDAFNLQDVSERKAAQTHAPTRNINPLCGCHFKQFATMMALKYNVDIS